MYEMVDSLLSSPHARDLYVARHFCAGMSREDLLRHINSLFELPHHKDLRDRLLHAWWKYTGEGSPRKRRRAPKDHSIHFYRILTEQEARDAYVQTFRNKPRKYFVERINRAYPLPHHKELRDRLFETWPATDIRGDKAVPPVLAESARNADQ